MSCYQEASYPGIVISTLKKAETDFREAEEMDEGLKVSIGHVCGEVEIDEQWSYVGSKSNQRWIWYAVDHGTNTVLAYVFGKRKGVVFKALKALLDSPGN